MPAVRWREATIEQIVRRTPHAVSVFFSNPLGPHRAGQHVDLRLVADDGYEARRSYSIASAPDSDRIELLIERLADGEVSPYFHDVARAGDTIELLGPLGGHFVWPRSLPGPLLLVAGGSGIAPLMAMLRHRARALPAVPAALLYGGRTWDELAFRDELLALADASPSFALTFATSARRRAGHATWDAASTPRWWPAPSPRCAAPASRRPTCAGPPASSRRPPRH